MPESLYSSKVKVHSQIAIFTATKTVESQCRMRAATHDSSVVRVRDNASAGLAVYKHGAGIFTECDIHGNAVYGVLVRGQGSNPRMERCKIHSTRSTVTPGGIKAIAVGVAVSAGGGG